MQNIFAQLCSYFSQKNYKQQVLMLRVKLAFAKKSRCLHAKLPIAQYHQQINNA